METINVQQVMTEKVTVATQQHKVSQVMDFFRLYNIHHLPVTDNDKIIGIISVTDIMKLLHDKLFAGENISLEELDKQVSIRDIMTPTPITINPDSEISEAMAILLQGGFHALPVESDGKLRGIITDYDLMKSYYKEKRPPMHFSVDAPGYGI